MKRLTIKLLVVVVVFGSFFSINGFARANDDYKVIKKSLKKVSKEVNEEVSWFKILVTDTKTGDVKVKVTIPVAIVEAFTSACPEGNYKINGAKDLDIKKLLKELKKAGPMALIEVNEENETVKIWLE
jgi:hypothetical protein